MVGDSNMKKIMNMFCLALALTLTGSLALAKLPAPSDEAKAKAAEAAAKTAWSGKVDAYLLCKSQDSVVAHVKKVKASAAASACVDPGPFVYTPAGAAPAGAASAPAAASAVTPAKKS
jgi:hypothetical protein